MIQRSGYACCAAGALGLALVLLAFGPMTATGAADRPQLAQADARPDQVVVFEFAVSPDEVELNHGLLARVRGLLNSEPRSAQEKQVGQEVAGALATKLVAKLTDAGLSAVRAGQAQRGDGKALLVKGQFLSIDQGNRAARVIIGLGAGRSDIEVQVQLYESFGDRTQLVDRLQAEEESGRKPGMAEMAGVGGLLGHVLVSTAVSGGLSAASERFRADVEALAERLAGDIADQIVAFYKRRDWS